MKKTEVKNLVSGSLEMEKRVFANHISSCIYVCMGTEGIRVGPTLVRLLPGLVPAVPQSYSAYSGYFAILYSHVNY
jgi:hypothetical protein